MTKNIIIGILVALCFAMGVYNMVLRTESLKYQQLALVNAVLAKRNEEQAVVAARLAEKNAEEAKHQEMIAETAYQDCLKRRK